MHLSIEGNTLTSEPQSTLTCSHVRCEQSRNLQTWHPTDWVITHRLKYIIRSTMWRSAGCMPAWHCIQRRNEVRWRPGQEASLATHVLTEVFRKQMYCIQETIVGTFRRPPATAIRRPRSDLAPPWWLSARELCPPCYAPDCMTWRRSRMSLIFVVLYKVLSLTFHHNTV